MSDHRNDLETTMPRTLSVQELKADFDTQLDEVQNTSIPLVVESDGMPVAVVITPDQFQQLQQIQRERTWRALDELRERNAGEDPDEVLKFVTEIVDEVRRERREQRRSADPGGR
ncbi:MAG TPA: type II toxin-antitoxin system prevent-host-death family antitoxin [Thermomicrobiales bacterium]|nr:type II toxin-antitoxin system prevent-host-death family antitoxin [Thermomicrobiales bacterium]